MTPKHFMLHVALFMEQYNEKKIKKHNEKGSAFDKIRVEFDELLDKLQREFEEDEAAVQS